VGGSASDSEGDTAAVLRDVLRETVGSPYNVLLPPIVVDAVMVSSDELLVTSLDDVRVCVCVTLSSPRVSVSASVVVTLDVAVRDAVASTVADAVWSNVGDCVVVAAVSDASGDIVSVGVGPSTVSDAVCVVAGVLERVRVGISIEFESETVMGMSAVAVAGVAVRTTETHCACGELLFALWFRKYSLARTPQVFGCSRVVHVYVCHAALLSSSPPNVDINTPELHSSSSSFNVA
jgi:hypothetical protein